MRPQTSKPHSKVAIWVGLILLVFGTVVLWQRDYVADSLRVAQYMPPSEIVAINNAAKFTDLGRFYFYASQPTLDGTQNFSEQCGKYEQSSNIIGCYVNSRIYLYDVKNDELKGVEEVTAAHEMLHAAYDRLPSNEKGNIDELLEAEVVRHSTDEAFVERMRVYEGLPQADKVHEYHSVIGTEMRDISSELERHYQQYFQDRLHLVSMYEGYSGILRNLISESELLANELDSQAVEINQMIASYNQGSLSLTADIEQFNRRASRGDFSSAAAFEQERQALESRATSLDQMHQRINRMIDEYNNSKSQYEGLAQHLTTLNNSLDSRLAPAPAVN